MRRQGLRCFDMLVTEQEDFAERRYIGATVLVKKNNGDA